MVALPREITHGIVENLRPLRPRRIVLFGSRARGETTDAESDIDLVVVLAREGRPHDYREKMDNALEVRRCLRDINRAFSIDAFVFTEQEWDEFQEQRPEFAGEIERYGVVLG